MKIGTVRAEEARVFDQYAGYHHFHGELQPWPTVGDNPDYQPREEYGSFEIFWHNGRKLYGEDADEESVPLAAGWYWWACFPGCMPDGEPMGPFADSRQALQDADEWNPEFDE